jgi:hypothetical protein
MSLSFPANIAAECPQTDCCILGDKIKTKKKLLTNNDYCHKVDENAVGAECGAHRMGRIAYRVLTRTFRKEAD